VREWGIVREFGGDELWWRRVISWWSKMGLTLDEMELRNSGLVWSLGRVQGRIDIGREGRYVSVQVGATYTHGRNTM
jgi:hypothetical protein